MSEPQRIGLAMTRERLFGGSGNCTPLTGWGSVHYRVPNQPTRSAAFIPDAAFEKILPLLQGKSPWPAFFTGGVGSGKTCAALSLIDQHGGFYATAGQFHALVVDASKGQSTWSTGYPMTTKEVWEPIDDSSLVVIDELATRSQTSEAAYETLKRIMDKREGKPAIFVSNGDLKTVAKCYDERIASRLAGGSVVDFGTRDLRVFGLETATGKETP